VTTSAIAAGAAGPKVWQELPIAGQISVAQGQRYAALADVTRDASLSSIESYLTAHGWAVTYGWQEGQASRGLYAVDAWLDGLSPDATSNHRWVWIEANRTGPAASVGAASSWPLTIYALGKAFVAVAAPPGALPSLAAVSSPAAPPVPGAVWVLGGAAVLGLLYYLW
jgi:hypothetical protein